MLGISRDLASRRLAAGCISGNLTLISSGGLGAAPVSKPDVSAQAGGISGSALQRSGLAAVHWVCRSQNRSLPTGAAHRADHILRAAWASGSHDLRTEWHQTDIFCVSRAGLL